MAGKYISILLLIVECGSSMVYFIVEQFYCLLARCQTCSKPRVVDSKCTPPPSPPGQSPPSLLPDPLTRSDQPTMASPTLFRVSARICLVFRLELEACWSPESLWRSDLSRGRKFSLSPGLGKQRKGWRLGAVAACTAWKAGDNSFRLGPASSPVRC